MNEETEKIIAYIDKCTEMQIAYIDRCMEIQKAHTRRWVERQMAHTKECIEKVRKSRYTALDLVMVALLAAAWLCVYLGW